MGERIKLLRKSLKLTQEEFGIKVGVTQSTVAGWENDIRSPGDAIILSICREFGVSEAWLVAGEGDMFIEKDEDEILYEWCMEVIKSPKDDIRHRYMNMLKNLPPEGWKIFEDSARFLAMRHDEEGQE